jgi:hypothetical protein
VTPRVSLLVAIFASSALACSPLLDVHAVTAPGAHPERLRTFSLGETEPIAGGYEPTTRSLDVQRRAWTIVARLLEAKGYRASSQGELLIRMASGRQERMVARSLAIPHPSPSRPAWFIENERVDEGALVIDAYDRSSGELVWHGGVQAELDPTNRDNALLERAVTSVLAAFPSAVGP